MGKTLLFITNCILYVVNLSSYLILIKYIETAFRYNNFWFSNLLSIALSPLYFIYLKRFFFRIKQYRYSILFPMLAGGLYTIEAILLYYSINNITLSYYTILRSSFILWNVPFFICFLKKKVSYLYYVSCILLCISYSISIYYYIKLSAKNWQPTLAILSSCLINAIYNNLIEFSLKKYSIPNMDYHVIFQLTYFILAIVPSVIYTFESPPPIEPGYILIMYLLIAISIQFYIINKISILKTDSSIVPSNVLLSGLDLIRRIVLLLFSFLFFNEVLDTFLIIGLAFFSISSILLFIDYSIPILKMRRQQEQESLENIDLLAV